TLQGARPKLADFCSATMAEFYSAVDTDDHFLIEDQLANIKEARRAVVVNALQPHAAIRSAAVQEASKQ
ncbi:hypothetical protein PXK01_17530, partial [Phaeobacter sp. PT47_59]|uniref:hypothetical protein n=1 Tax=Phaeobacter sp. PT47_59 TaxID=3029979 RepID=UPI0023809DE0